MNRLGTWLVAGVVAASLLGCQKEDPATKDKLAKLLTKTEAMQKKADQSQAAPPGRGAVAGAPGQPPQRPNQPDPMATYSVPIGGDPIKGNPAALITVVEAAEFA